MKVHFCTLFIFFAAYFLVPQAYGQASDHPAWVPYFQNEQITIELSQSRRNDSINDIYNDYLLIRLTNKTDQTVHLSFKKQLEYNLSAVPSDNAIDLTLQPHQSLEGSTDSATDKSLRIFVSQRGRNKKVLTNYSLIDIQSSPISGTK